MQPVVTTRLFYLKYQHDNTNPTNRRAADGGKKGKLPMAFLLSFANITIKPVYMITATNIAFTLLIKLNGRQREFNFRQRRDSNYDTDTNDDHGNRYTFRMEKVNDSWKIIGKLLPAWLLESEGVINEALEKHG